MKKVVLYSHGGSGNRGCEAIVRGTYKIMRDQLQETPVYLCSLNKDEDEAVGLSSHMNIVPYSNYVTRKSVDHMKAAAMNRLFGKADYYVTLAQKNLYELFGQETLAVSIGGDNYCYTDSKWLYLSHKEAKRKRAKTVLWGCSLEEKNMDDEMIRDLSSYDLIIARESLTYELLLRKNIAKNTKLFPDPAFQLDYEEVELPAKFARRNTIGINLSPYIFSTDIDQEQVIDMYAGFIRHLLSHTDSQIALIPHVFWSHSSDLDVMRQVLARAGNEERVFIVEARFNCMQMKYVISQCRMFIGARTHSTIAAYSTCVPTLVLGYSVKSRGIARDIFGSEKDMVISVKEIRSTEDLITAFNHIWNREDSIRAHLKQIMPDYKSRVVLASNELKKLVSGR
ncbi:polysaccharide pyruvyl transferase family protein [Paenibacillus antri]|uniref:Polysaccharide pyruvyl transferase family protein n=1 Tax=Paenibacillus antri TaxID=2582848 RepID=A0A5R9G321_9BACL|nr:polysaccharide pyruvyl transferase family protein [Paenibacillus antri]TLS49409.1 polysaccharide pyruvyl transferase family protein [Paenibacillus antri]